MIGTRLLLCLLALVTICWVSLALLIGLTCYGNHIDPHTRLPVPNVMDHNRRHLIEMTLTVSGRALVASCLACPLVIFFYERNFRRQWRHMARLLACYAGAAAVMTPLYVLILCLVFSVPLFAPLLHDWHRLVSFVAEATLEMFFVFIFIPVTMGYSTIRLLTATFLTSPPPPSLPYPSPT